MFSADFRRAIAAEAAGDYDEAARAYALAGERAKVAAMHLFRAERSPSPEAKLSELRAAIRWNRWRSLPTCGRLAWRALQAPRRHPRAPARLDPPAT